MLKSIFSNPLHPSKALVFNVVNVVGNITLFIFAHAPFPSTVALNAFFSIVVIVVTFLLPFASLLTYFVGITNFVTPFSMAVYPLSLNPVIVSPLVL